MARGGFDARREAVPPRRRGQTQVIVSLDPEAKPICGQPVRWLDTVKQDRYLGPEAFVDLTKMDWGAKMREHGVRPDEVLVYIDDHLPFFPRVATFLRHGFAHVMLEDNYALGEGATPGDKWVAGRAASPSTHVEGRRRVGHAEANLCRRPLEPAGLARGGAVAP